MTAPMVVSSCTFCSIARAEAPATITYEDDIIVAFKDIAPMAPFHELVIPRRHIDGLETALATDASLLGWMLLVGRRRASEAGFGPDGFRIVMNHNQQRQQTVGHLHVHLLAGRPLRWLPG